MENDPLKMLLTLSQNLLHFGMQSLGERTEEIYKPFGRDESGVRRSGLLVHTGYCIVMGLLSFSSA